MPATSKPGERFYRPELDALRFAAFCFVFLHHILPHEGDGRLAALPDQARQALAAVVSSCGFGVSLFFVLSAYLISEILIRERNKTGTVSVSHFYYRRILRIWPLYFFGTAIGILLTLLPAGYGGTTRAMLPFLFFGGAWSLAFHGMPGNPMELLWSVTVEEQFYLFAPWVAKFLKHAAFGLACVAIVVFSMVYLGWIGASAQADYRVWFDPFVHFGCFAAGMAAALILNGRLPQAGKGTRAALATSGLLCWFVANYYFHARFPVRPNPGPEFLVIGYDLAVAGSLLMLLSVLGIDAKLLPGWLTYLGKISYGLYVYHFLVVSFVGLFFGRRVGFHGPLILVKGVLAFLLTILVASLSYRWLEKPFLRLKSRVAVIETGAE